MLRKIILSGFVLISVLALSNCYRMPIPQGNILTNRDISKVHRGMTPTEVVNTLGTPVLNNIYANNQLAYVYTFKRVWHHMLVKRVIIYFQGGVVSNVVYDVNQVTTPVPPEVGAVPPPTIPMKPIKN